jgi:hypothetical protein
MILRPSHWYFSHFIDILIVCSFVVSLYFDVALAQNLPLTLDNLQDTSKNEWIKKNIPKHRPPWYSPLIPFDDTFLSSPNNLISQQKIVPLTDLLLVYPDLRNGILKDYLRTQLCTIDTAAVRNEATRVNFTPLSYLENELRRNFHRYGVSFDPFRPTPLQMSLSISFEPLRLIFWLLHIIRSHIY